MLPADCSRADLAEVTKGNLAGMSLTPRGASMRSSRQPLELAAIRIVVYIAGGCIAFALALFCLSRQNGLYGVTEYDDGVYFGATMHLLSGQLPYRDFVFVQPPGITILLSPLGLIGHIFGSREGIALARIVTAIIAGANAVLAALVMRHRGILASGVAGLVLGVFPPAFIADRTLELEPYLVCLCLIGVACVFSGAEFASNKRIIWGGVFFGLAGTVKSFAILPVFVLAILLFARKRQVLFPFVVAALAGFVIPCLPFFIAAPHGFIHDVITSQLGRQTLRRASLPTRLAAIVGLADAARSIHISTTSSLPAIIAAFVGAIVLFGSILPSILHKGSTFEWFCLGSTVAAIAAILIAAPFYNHYTYFSAVFLALVLAHVAWRCAAALRARGFDDRTEAQRRVFSGAVAAAVLACIVCVAALITSTSKFDAEVMDHFGDPGPTIASVIPAGSCAVTDAYSLLVSANRISPTDPKCPVIVDATGTWLSYSPDDPPLPCGCGPKDPSLVAAWKGWLSQATYAVFAGARSFRIPWTPALRSWFRANYTQSSKTTLPIYVNIHRVPAGQR